MCGTTPMPTTTRSAGSRSPSRSRTTATSARAVAVQCGDLLAEQQPDARLRVPLGEHTCDIGGREGTGEGAPLRLDDRHVVAQPSGGGRDFEADEPGADHDNLAGGPVQPRPQRLGVGEVAQRQHTGAVRTGHRKGARAGSRWRGPAAP